MSGTHAPAPWLDRVRTHVARPARLLRRPSEFVARIRRLFALSALAALVLTPIGVVVTGTPWTVTLLPVSCPGLSVSCPRRYRLRRLPVLFDVPDAVFLLVFALACSQP